MNPEYDWAKALQEDIDKEIIEEILLTPIETMIIIRFNHGKVITLFLPLRLVDSKYNRRVVYEHIKDPENIESIFLIREYVKSSETPAAL